MRRHLRYLVTLGLLVAALQGTALTACIGLYRSEWYVRHSWYFYDFLVKQRFESAGGPADVLIVGDSSALYGANPKIIEEEAPGLRVLNAALFGFSGARSMRAVVDSYLARYPAPRLVVLHIGAMNPGFEQHPPFTASYERMYPVLRYGSFAEIVKLFLRDSRYFQIAASHIIYHLQQVPSISTDGYNIYFNLLASNGGWLENLAPRLADDCRIDSRLVYSDLRYIGEIRAYLRARGIRTALYISPLASCDVSLDYYAALYKGVADNHIHQLPYRYLTDHVHLNREGAEVNSREVGRLIRSMLQEEPERRGM